mgnify:CR=1 FL=1|tara:strand:- start:1304 stop:1480 length:177 start_codon:yes stop_codon:yes gene_type:complete
MTLKSNIILGSGGHSIVILENLYILKKNVKYISIEVYSKNLKKLKSLQDLIKKKYDKY